MKRQKVDNINQKTEKNPEKIFDAIHSLMHIIRGEQYRVLRDSPYELTHMEGKMLGFFHRNPGATLSDLVERTGRDKGQIARTLKVLKEAGLVTSKSGPNDRRSQRISLSAEGKRIHDSLHDKLDELTQQAVDGMSKANCEQLVTLLEQVRANLDKSAS